LGPPGGVVGTAGPGDGVQGPGVAAADEVLPACRGHGRRQMCNLRGIGCATCEASDVQPARHRIGDT
jgi:hypothetical protein